MQFSWQSAELCSLWHSYMCVCVSKMLRLCALRHIHLCYWYLFSFRESCICNVNAAIMYLLQTSDSSIVYTTMSFILPVIYYQFQSFLRSRMLAYQDGLTAYVEAQIKTARDTYTLLAKTMTVLKQMEEWCSHCVLGVREMLNLKWLYCPL